MKKNILAVIAAYKNTGEFLAEEIRQLLDFDCHIRIFFMENEEDASFYDETPESPSPSSPKSAEQYKNRIAAFDLSHCSLVVFSSEFIQSLVTGYIGALPMAQVVTKRNIDMSKIPELIGIESGTEVYAFGSSKEASEELIGDLKETGITHLNLQPYYPGAQRIRNEIIITPGKFIAQMSEAHRIIDVDYRTLRISTVMEIFIALNLPASKLAPIENWYRKQIRSMNKYNAVINKNVTGILEAINEGIFCVSAEGRVLFCNKTFLTLTDMDYYRVVGKHFEEIGFGPKLSAILHYKGNLSSEIIEYASRRLLLTRLETEPQAPSGFIISMQDVTRIHQLETDVRKKLVQKGFVAKYTPDKIICQSAIMKQRIQETLKIASSDYTVLLTGDNGTGKEMFAQVIHNCSDRASHPFVAVNLGSLSESLIESELFGYDEGAFTGAMKGGKASLFELAHNGTIFIDEIGDVSLHIQQRLLRVLQEREVMRVGGKQIIPVNVRIIAATNKNLFEMVQENTFRMDLYYRLKVLHINIPPLKERREDVPLLLTHFFKEIHSRKYMSYSALRVLQDYSWPGNVREVQNLVYYLETLCENTEILVKDLPEEFQMGSHSGNRTPSTSPTGDASQQEIFALITASVNVEVLQDFIFILTQLNIARQNGISMSRNQIHKLSTQRKSGLLTVERLRSRFNRLEQYGLIHVGNTRQGSHITQRGELFLTWITEQV